MGGAEAAAAAWQAQGNADKGCRWQPEARNLHLVQRFVPEPTERQRRQNRAGELAGKPEGRVTRPFWGRQRFKPSVFN